MKYAVIKTYEVEAKSEKEAEGIIAKLEEKIFKVYSCDLFPQN